MANAFGIRSRGKRRKTLPARTGGSNRIVRTRKDGSGAPCPQPFLSVVRSSRPGKRDDQNLQSSFDALGLLSLISIATPAPALDAATKALNIGEWEALWTRVLTRHVDESGRIDFDALSQNHA